MTDVLWQGMLTNENKTSLVDVLVMASGLPREFEDFVQQELASGRYGSQTDVICAGLRLLRERDSRLASLRNDVKLGIDQLDRGEGRPLDAESIKARGRQRHPARDIKVLF